MSEIFIPDPVTITVPAAMKASGLGRTKLYELIARKEIESVRVGARRLIVFASLKARLTAKAASPPKGGSVVTHQVVGSPREHAED